MNENESRESIIAEMRHVLDQSWHDIDREWVRGLPDRIEAAWKRDVAKVEADALAVGGIVEAARHSPSGNAAAMRDALMEIRVCAMSDYEPGADYLIDKCNAAFSAPPRNCDVGTAEEQIRRFNDYCNAHYGIKCNEPECGACPLWTSGLCGEDCLLKWAQMPYEAEEGAGK